MKINVLKNGVAVTRDMTPEEIAESKKHSIVIPYEQRVVDHIRAVYSVDDEIALLRQRDTKPQEFAKYNAFVEQIKAQERVVLPESASADEWYEITETEYEARQEAVT